MKGFEIIYFVAIFSFSRGQNLNDENPCENVMQFQLVRNPDDIYSYYECDGNGLSDLKVCDDDLEWSQIRKECLPSLKCPNKNSKFNPCRGIEENEDVLLPNPRNLSTFIECVYGCPQIRPCPTNLRFSKYLNQCDWPERVPDIEVDVCENADIDDISFDLDPEDCAVYYVCISGVAIENVCEDGHAFDSSLKQCSLSEDCIFMQTTTRNSLNIPV